MALAFLQVCLCCIELPRAVDILENLHALANLLFAIYLSKHDHQPSNPAIVLDYLANCGLCKLVSNVVLKFPPHREYAEARLRCLSHTMRVL